MICCEFIRGLTSTHTYAGIKIVLSSIYCTGKCQWEKNNEHVIRTFQKLQNRKKEKEKGRTINSIPFNYDTTEISSKYEKTRRDDRHLSELNFLKIRNKQNREIVI